ncbi:MAG: ATP-binding cassette domain-containing protein [Paracoccaceae bacterium]|nr:ATP-binding cassette domain-containing protein [Paracoccaceae bacterium]
MTRPRTETPAARLAQLAAPAAPALRRASALSVLAALIWPVQAALVAAALGGLVTSSGLSLPPLWAALGFVALAGLRAGLDGVAQAAAQRTARDLVAATRARLLTAACLQRVGGGALSPAELAALVAEKAATLGPWASRYAPAMARTRWVPLVFLALAATQSWAAAVILLIAGPLIPLFMALVGMAAETASRQQMAEIGALNRLAIDRIAAITDLRLLGAGARARADLARASDDLRTRTMAVLRIAFLSSTVLELFSALGVALVAVFVGFSLLGEIGFGTWGGQMTPVQGIFLLMIAPEFFQPLRDLAAAWHDRAAALAVASELTEAEAAMARSGTILGTGAPGLPLPAAPLSWQGLRIAPGPGAPARAFPDGHVAPGEAVALTGPSGVGKTTLLAALAGLIRADAGQIRWGDTVLDDTSAKAIRAGLAWVPQSPRFPDAPLAEAITLGQPGDLGAALAAARAQAIVATLPDGLQTRLGDLGGGVSGGEARRLALARAYLVRPHLVLADEPTADLDAVTAQAVTEGLLALRAQGAALLIATHDPALIAALDRDIPLSAEDMA